jgi:anti-sigma-K factor RskA
MDDSEDNICLAAEYALGTLDAEERSQAETMMSADTEFAAVVQAWEFRLGVLNQMVGSVEPSPELWDRIRAAVGISGERQAPLVLPEAPPPLEALSDALSPVEAPAPEETPRDDMPLIDLSDIAEPPAPVWSRVATVGNDAPEVVTSNVVPLTGKAQRWRSIASVTSALAAALVALIGFQLFAPDWLPDMLRPKVRTEVVEVKTKAPPPVPSAQYVALLQGQSGGPAFILTVDGTTKDFTVRKLGAPPTDAGKSYELWLISDKLGNRPRSLGVIGAGDFTARPILAAYDSDVISGATYAVTIEQAGGSPDGAPHSQPVFAGKLIETVQPR